MSACASRRFATASLWLALPVLSACRSEPLSTGASEGSADYVVAAGERCAGEESHCADASTLLVCEDYRWKSVDCVANCASVGASALGCRLGAGDQCVCDFEGSECVPGETRCEAEDRLLRCDESGHWQTVSCTVACAELSTPMLSAGCHLAGYSGDFACRCTLDGLPCEGSLALCEGYSFLRRCIDGTWQVEDCGAASVSPSKIGLCVVGVEEKPASCDFWEPAP